MPLGHPRPPATAVPGPVGDEVVDPDRVGQPRERFEGTVAPSRVHGLVGAAHDEDAPVGEEAEPGRRGDDELTTARPVASLQVQTRSSSMSENHSRLSCPARALRVLETLNHHLRFRCHDQR
jgi:hypothetical protein